MTRHKTLTQNYVNKKYELMLMRRAKVYSSSCSQTVSLSAQFILGSVCCRQISQKSI